MEKLKDLLHDFTDILLAIAIAGVMFFVVSFYLGDWFQAPHTVIAAEDTSLPIVDNLTPENSLDNGAVDEAEPVEEDALPDSEDLESQSEEEASETPEVPEVPETPVVPEDAPLDDTPVVQIKTITVPNGTPGVGVAAILQENGLIESTADFIRAAEELQLSLSLKSGTFQIPSDATVEEMVRIIARATQN